MPRIRHIAGSEIPLRCYEAMRGDRSVDDLLLRRVLFAISCSQLRGRRRGDSRRMISLSSSTVSRGFIQASAAQLRAFQERDLSGVYVEAVFLDGKTCRRLDDGHRAGHHADGGEVRCLGFVDNGHGERDGADEFLRSLVELRPLPGVLVILDGGKGLTAIRKAYPEPGPCNGVSGTGS